MPESFKTICRLAGTAVKDFDMIREGDRILDTHLGSGSSRIAAWDAGLDFVGCEIDKVYFDLQEKRFEAHAAQGNLFLMAE